MIRVTISLTRENTDVEWFTDLNPEYYFENYISKNKVLPASITYSDDGLNMTIISTYVEDEYFVEMMVDQEMARIRQKRHDYNHRNNIASVTFFDRIN